MQPVVLDTPCPEMAACVKVSPVDGEMCGCQGDRIPWEDVLAVRSRPLVVSGAGFPAVAAESCNVRGTRVTGDPSAQLRQSCQLVAQYLQAAVVISAPKAESLALGLHHW